MLGGTFSAAGAIIDRETQTLYESDTQQITSEWTSERAIGSQTLRPND